MTVDVHLARPARRLLPVLALAVALLAACSKPLDTVIPTNPDDWDSKLAPAVKKLSEEDRQLFNAYMARRMMGSILGGLFGQKPEASAITPGTTIGQAIAEQKAWMAEQEREEAARARKEAEAAALKREAEAKAAAARKALDDAVTVALVDRGFLPSDYRAGRILDQQTISIAIKNTSGKPIAGVSGRLAFIDMFDKEVGAVTFKSTETIAPDETYTWEGSRDYNQFMAGHRAVRDLEDGKFKTRFEPEAIVFVDGSTLKVE